MWAVATHNSEPSFELRVNLNAMLEAIKFPGSIADLNKSLTDVDRNALFHFREGDNVVPFNVFLFFFFLNNIFLFSFNYENYKKINKNKNKKLNGTA